MNTIEERLEIAAADVREKAALVPPRTSGSVARRTSLVRAIQAATTVVAVFAILAATALLSGRSDHATTDTTDNVVSGTDGMPPLLVDTARVDPNLSLVYVQDDTIPASATDNERYLRSYGPASAGLADPRLWLVTYPNGSDFFRGEGFRDPGWDTIEVPTGRASITSQGATTVVMWQVNDDTDGPVLRIQAFGIDSDTVTTAVASIADAEAGWVVQTPPDGFVELYAGPEQSAPGGRTVMLVWMDRPYYVAPEITLWLYEGQDQTVTEIGLHDAVLDPSTDASVVAQEIRGHAGARLTTPDGVFYVWMETPTVFARLLVQGATDPQQVLDSLTEIDRDSWNNTIDTWTPPPLESDTPLTTIAPTTTGTE